MDVDADDCVLVEDDVVEEIIDTSSVPKHDR